MARKKPPGPLQCPTAIKFRVGEHLVSVRVTITEVKPKRAKLRAELLDDVEQAAFDAATSKPATIKALMKLAGYKSYTHFRAAVGRLLTRGLLARVPKGIIRAG